MQVKLLNAINYNNFDKRIDEVLSLYDNLNVDKESLKQEIKDAVDTLEKERRCQIVSSAGNLSRSSVNVFDVLENKGNHSFYSNTNFASKVIGMGHTSISELDYCVFALKDVSVLVEQTIIEERYSAFTIKSRREVDFSKVGYYVPEFRDKTGNIHSNNENLKKEYEKHIDFLFDEYNKFLDLGVSKEDARFILPYCYNSNILMGIDAHTLRDLIIKFTKTKYSKVQELKEFGEQLYNIAKENLPYIIPSIDEATVKEDDLTDNLLNEKINLNEYKIIDGVRMLDATSNVDETICCTAIMRRYQCDYDKAKNIYYSILKENPNFSYDLIKSIAFDSDKMELSHVNFRFQIPISFAVLTHLTRHRAHDIIIPDFVPVVDLKQYKVPPKIKGICLDEYNKVFEKNAKVYDSFKEEGVFDYDLPYFTLSGNMVNVLTDINGKNVCHILGLRECNKAQWEIRKVANDIHSSIQQLNGAEAFSSVLGPSCVTENYCKEGKESCGRILTLNKKGNH